MKTIFFVLLASSLLAAGASYETIVEPILPTRAYTHQCKDICRCASYDLENCEISEIQCHPNSSNTWLNCCDWCRTK